MSRTPVSGLDRLRAAIEAEGGLLVDALTEPRSDPLFDKMAAGGERSRDRPTAYAEALESILEGFLLHYGRPRLIDSDDDDLRVLAGDFCYAHGLDRLTEIGDREAISELAELIARSASLVVSESVNGSIEDLWLAATVAAYCGGEGCPAQLQEEAKLLRRLLGGALSSAGAL